MGDAGGSGLNRTPNPKLYSFELTMDVDTNAGSTADISITVFWNDEVYEALIYAPPATGVHTFLAADTFMYNDYNSLASPDKAKMLIQNNINSDAAIFTSMKLTLEDGTYYGAESFCADAASVGSYYPNLMASGNQCAPGLTNYRAVCVDHYPDQQCNPSDLMVYFDKRYPNQLIDNAFLGDAGALIVEGCELNVSPRIARKCARKGIQECIDAESCNLVTNTIKTTSLYPNQDYEQYEFEQSQSKTLGVEWENNERIIPENVFFVMIAMSIIANLYFYFGAKEKNVELNGDAMAATTPLLENA